MAVHTPAVADGWQAADFRLPATDGNSYSLADIRGPNGVVIAFICNHCPYVKAIAARLVTDAATLSQLGVGLAAICANDAEAYPEDSFDNMKIFGQRHGFFFPYLYDESQAVARSYDAVCTPDFYGFDRDLRLRYRGRLDSAGRNGPATEDARRELVDAMHELIETNSTPMSQQPSIGCSIKWRAA